MESREAFETDIYDIWADYFGLPAFFLKDGGSSVDGMEDLSGTNRVVLFKIGERSFAQCDVELNDLLADIMQKIAHRKGGEYGMTSADIQVELVGKHIEYDEIVKLFYLYAGDFKPYHSNNFKVRQLTQADATALEQLKSACSKKDVDEGFVNVADELAFGAFDGEKMVACASMFDWRGFADPGVLVHPDYRQRGLGKAVVSPICEWVLDKGRVMTYRCVTTNHGSSALAESLGFTHYFNIDYFKVIDNA